MKYLRFAQSIALLSITSCAREPKTVTPIATLADAEPDLHEIEVEDYDTMPDPEVGTTSATPPKEKKGCVCHEDRDDGDYRPTCCAGCVDGAGKTCFKGVGPLPPPDFPSV